MVQFELGGEIMDESEGFKMWFTIDLLNMCFLGHIILLLFTNKLKFNTEAL